MNTEQPLLGNHQMISFNTSIHKNRTRFLAFLACVGVLTAAFAFSGLWINRREWFSGGESSAPIGEENNDLSTAPSQIPQNKPSVDNSIDDSQTHPENSISVFSMDLSCDWNDSRSFLQNQSIQSIGSEIYENGFPICTSTAEGPLVLILHTHASEAYLPEDTTYLAGSVGDRIYSDERSRSVIAVGAALCDALNEHGIPAIQCSQKHGKDGSLQNAYADSEACIKAYLKKYPSIQYVIDVHRDGILNQDGTLVKTQAEKNGLQYGQVMAVVGSDGNGTECPNWKSNLALAVQLCKALNETAVHLCRPISLRNQSYNQELAPRSLLLEIGSAGNTQEEAIRSAKLVGQTLAQLITENTPQ